MTKFLQPEIEIIKFTHCDDAITTSFLEPDKNSYIENNDEFEDFLDRLNT